MKTLRIIRVVFIIILSILFLEAKGQSFNPDSELEEIILKLQPKLSSWNGAQSLSQDQGNGVVLISPISPISFWLYARYGIKADCMGSENEDISGTDIHDGKTASYVDNGDNIEYFLSESLILGNENDSLVDDKKYDFSKNFIKTGRAFPHNTSFLSQPIIKLGFRF